VQRSEAHNSVVTPMDAEEYIEDAVLEAKKCTAQWALASLHRARLLSA
jgi:hypothetical protein